MADIKYEVAIDDKASAVLGKIQANVTKATAAFGRFQTAVAGLGLAALQRSAIGYADAIKDISDATDIAIENVLGFQKAVSAAGGNVEKAQAAIVKFNLSIADAAAGSLQAQDAFSQIGITLGDLQTLSEQDLFTKAIQGLGQIADTSLRAKLSNELFGKTLKGVNLRGLADDYLKASAAAKKYAEDIRRGAELNDKLDAAFSKLKLSVLQAMAPTIDFFNNLDEGQVNRFIDAVVKIGGAAVAIAAAVKGFQVLATALSYLGVAAAGAWAVFKGGAALIASGAAAISASWLTVSNLFKNIFQLWSIGFTSAAGVIARVVTTFEALMGSIGVLAPALGAILLGFGKIALVVTAIVGVVWAVDKAIKAAFDVSPIDWFLRQLSTAYDKFKDFVGLSSGKTALPDTGAGAGRGGNPELTKQLQDRGEEMRRQWETAQQQLKVQREVQDALEKQKREISRISLEFGKQLDNKANQLQLETDIIGKSEKQRDLMNALADLTQRTTDEVDKLRKAQADLTDEQRRGGLGALYEQQIAAVQQLAKTEQIRLAALVDGLAKAKSLEEFRLYTLKQQQDAEDKLLGLQRDIADIGLTDIEKKYREITRAADDAAKSAIRAEEARRGSKLNPEEVKAYYDEARKGTSALLEAQKKLYDSSRTFSSGWNKSFKDYVENARDAAAQATRLFDKFTQGLEDALVDFAKTGKFEWKKFVASMAEELLRSQIKQTLASVLQISNPFGSGSIGDMFGGLFGGLLGGGSTQRGQSAAQPLFVMDVSGGLGGGFMGPPAPGGIGGIGTGGGGIFDTIGKVFTGVKDAVGGVVSGIGSAIGSITSGIGSVISGGGIGGGSNSGGSFLGGIADSIGSLFDGWFANGGQIGAGKFGIVGERGPELVSGPATVTPMTGSTAVTYNIQAVDARSFQQLLASDPSFIFALTEQGRKSFAGAR